MSIYCVTPPAPVSVPEASAPKAPVVPTANLFDRIGPIGRRLGMVSF